MRFVVESAKENGRYLLDDVIFLKDENHFEESHLSKLLAEDCDGRRWVGYPSGNDLKQQE